LTFLTGTLIPELFHLGTASLTYPAKMGAVAIKGEARRDPWRRGSAQSHGIFVVELKRRGVVEISRHDCLKVSTIPGKPALTKYIQTISTTPIAICGISKDWNGFKKPRTEAEE